MKTIWEMMAESATPQEKNALNLAQSKFEASFLGGYGQIYVNSTRKVLLQKNISRRQLFIESGFTNTDVVYLGMDIQVSETNYFRALNPKDTFAMDMYAGEIWVYSPTGTQRLQYGEW